METANNFNRLDLNTKELLNFADELEQLRQTLWDQALKTLDKWKDFQQEEKILKAVGITQWIQWFEKNRKIKKKLKKEWYTDLFEKLCNSWRWEILAEVLDDEKNFKDIYNICKKLNNWEKGIN